MNKFTGIYKIINNLTNEFYIGSAVNFDKRWKEHKRRLNKGTHHSPILQNAWVKYGEFSFSFIIILYCERDNLLLYEQRAINVYKPKYNISPTAGSTLGAKHSLETKQKISNILIGNTYRKGKPSTETVKKQTSERLRGNTHRRGKPNSEETRKKISEANKGKPSPMTGKIHTREAKKKISKALLGKPMTKPVSDETKAKMRASRKAYFDSKKEKP
jgi:excinuclease UvrABC nuclease subunit